MEAILAAAAAAAAPPLVESDAQYVALADLIAAGYLDEGEPLVALRSSVTATATVLGDGRLEYLDEVFDSPSGAAKRAAGTVAENGWTFWFAERDGERVPLKDIRTQLVTAAADESTTGRRGLG